MKNILLPLVLLCILVGFVVACAPEPPPPPPPPEDLPPPEPSPEEYRQQKIDEYQESFSNPYAAASRGYVDMIIDPRETRPRLITTLEMLSTKRESLPGKKHGNIPL